MDVLHSYSESHPVPKDVNKIILDGISVTLFIGNIADVDADVIVNSTGQDLKLSSGAVSKAILAKAGEDLQRECKKHGYVNDGDVVKTQGYNLSCKSVLHCCCPNSYDPQLLKKIVLNCLNMTAKEAFSSIAFPALGTGKLAYPPEDVIATIETAIGHFAAKNSLRTMRHVILVVYDQDEKTKKAYREFFDRHYGLQEDQGPLKTLYSPSWGTQVQILGQALLKSVYSLWPLNKYDREPDEKSGELSDEKLVEVAEENHTEEAEEEPDEVAVPPVPEKVFPLEWSEPVDEYQEVILDQQSAEWEEIKDDFTSTSDSEIEILEIKRIQNPRPYEQYDIHRKYISKRLAADVDAIVERKLWHGTAEESASKISRTMFDRAQAGKNGTQYGAGCYFSTTTQYSHKYSRCLSYNRTCYMIRARVLTGEYTKGDRSMKSAPYKHCGIAQYDSVVDNSQKPTIFVTFQDSSAYPEYIVKYRQR